MTNSEKICNEIGEKFFCKDFVYQNLKYRNKMQNKIELCDGLFEYDECYIALQIKERNINTNGKSEEAWLKDVVYVKAVGQIKQTLRAIHNDDILVKDMYQQEIKLNKKYTIYPIIIFENSKISNYIKTIDVDGIKINIFEINDYKQMMETLVHPFEILQYIELRTKYIHASLPSIVFGGSKDVSIMSRIENEKNFAEFFILYCYNGDLMKQKPSLRILNIIEKFRKTQKNVNLEYKNLLRIFQKISPQCAQGFMERFDYAIEKSKKNKFDITKTVQIVDTNRKLG